MSTDQSLVDRALLSALRLLGAGRTLLERITGARAYADTSYLPRRFRKDPERAERRVARALEWLDALSKTLGGASTWLLPAPRRSSTPRPALPAIALPGATSRPVPSPHAAARRFAARRRTIRRAFATQPTHLIARRLARRLGVSPHLDGWPTDLLGITQTPAEWAMERRRQIAPQVLVAWRKSEAACARIARAAMARQPTPLPARDPGPIHPGAPAYIASG